MRQLSINTSETSFLEKKFFPGCFENFAMCMKNLVFFFFCFECLLVFKRKGFFHNKRVSHAISVFLLQTSKFHGKHPKEKKAKTKTEKKEEKVYLFF